MISLRMFRPDRRRWRREFLGASVNVFTDSIQMHGRALTISEGGMCLFAVSNLPVGAQVALEFCPPQAESSIRVSGTIRNRALYLYGIEFASSFGKVDARTSCTKR